MSLTDQRVLLTGAAGGIGRALSFELARHGARLVLLDRETGGLDELCAEVAALGAEARPLSADLGDLDSLPEVARRAEAAFGGIDVVIHNAGLMSFRPFDDEHAGTLDALMRVNVMAPMLLTRQLLPAMRARGSGHVLNIGSIFGSIGFAYFASYSASKFALRGWSEALRRELRGTGIEVHYVAPRATRTPLAKSFGRMAEAVGMKLDAPEWVARRTVRALTRGAKDSYLGFPECVFVRLNALLPRLVDKALAKQDARTRPFAEEAAAAALAHSAGARPDGSTTPPPASAGPTLDRPRAARDTDTQPALDEIRS